mmetsp:Transcript_101913/g.161104  ORF Transcript_101913/g.161104 Transcript_101913/m.161104 type:complete len:354 (-) Transcript_101913:43-1104(-)
MSHTEACSVELSERQGATARCNEELEGDDEAEEEDITHLKASAGAANRGRRRVKVGSQSDDAPRSLDVPDDPHDRVEDKLPTKRDVWVLGIVFFLSVLVALHFIVSMLTQEGKPWRWGCRQCQQDWWRDFWRWRLENSDESGNVLGVNKAPPPPGMDWNWGAHTNNTDWWVASDELVKKVVLPHVDSGLGPVLQIGCGDSPLAASLYQAGFRDSEHIDIEPRVVKALQKRYPEVEWPGMHFEVRDFLESASAGGGAPPPLHRFAAVVDKAGIWDWLVEEKPSVLPRLLNAVIEALVLAPRPGAYVVATKQKPSDFQETLSKYGSNGFAVEATRPLLSSTNVGASAWAYVLIPV